MRTIHRSMFLEMILPGMGNFISVGIGMHFAILLQKIQLAIATVSRPSSLETILDTVMMEMTES